jgi:hypothetical protein
MGDATMPEPLPETRRLSDEQQLIKWMLEHGSSDASLLLP